jgi:DNA transposition AAA+ family ATPase
MTTTQSQIRGQKSVGEAVSFPNNGAALTDSALRIPHSALAHTEFPSPEFVESKLVETGATPDQVDNVLWLLDFAQSQKIANFTQLGKEIAINSTTISRIFRGAYGAGLESIAKQIRHFRQLWTERQAWGDEIFVPELSVVRRLAKFTELVRAAGQIGVVWGPNQSGKSKALEYIANNTPMTAYAELLAGGGLKDSLEVIAKARGGIPTRKSTNELRGMLLKRFNRLWLLIVDEFHQTLIGRTLKTVTVESIRKIYDKSKTPILICGTDVVDEMFDDPKFKHFLGQIANRGVLRMRIPPAPTAKDVELLIAAYGFTHAPTVEAEKHIKRISHESGIGRLTKYFQVARRLANKAHERIAWKHFLTTHDTLASWEKGEFGNGEKK